MSVKYSILFFLIIELTSCTSTIVNDNLEGTYIGVFKHKNFEIDISFDVEADSSGYKVFFTSLKQNALRVPTRNVSTLNDSLRFTLQSDFYTYFFANKYDRVSNTFKGVLTVDSMDYPYRLNKTALNEKTETKEINFDSNGNILSGTSWIPINPNGQGLFFVTSSGRNDRSSSSAEVRYFSKKGFTVFHFDKRGTGKSSGNLDNVSIEDLAADDINAVQQFSKDTNIPLSKINIIGSSQGGAKVPLILNQLTELQSGISVSTPGCTLLESDLNFMMNRLKSQIGDDDILAATLVQRAVFEYLAGQFTKTKLEEVLNKNRNKEFYQYLWVPELNEEVHRGLSFSPIPHFEKLENPILIIQGMSDIVIPIDSFEKIEEALNKAGSKTYKIIKLANANHSMTLENVSDFPYWSMLHPDYFNTIEEWLNTVSVKK